MMSNFWQLAITPILKIWDFDLNAVDFLAKNLSDFVSLPWKLDNLYWHNIQALTAFTI